MAKSYQTFIAEATQKAVAEFTPHQKAVGLLMPKIVAANKGEKVVFTAEEQATLKNAAAAAKQFENLSGIFTPKNLAALATQINNAKGIQAAANKYLISIVIDNQQINSDSAYFLKPTIFRKLINLNSQFAQLGEKLIADFELKQRNFRKNDKVAPISDEKFAEKIKALNNERLIHITTIKNAQNSFITDCDNLAAEVQQKLDELKLKDVIKYDELLSLWDNTLSNKTDGFKNYITRLETQKELLIAQGFRKNFKNIGSVEAQNLCSDTINIIAGIELPEDASAETMKLVFDYQREFDTAISSMIAENTLRIATTVEEVNDLFPGFRGARQGGACFTKNNGKNIVVLDTAFHKATEEEAERCINLIKLGKLTESDAKKEFKNNATENVGNHSPESWLTSKKLLDKSFIAHEMQHLVQANKQKLLIKNTGTAFEMFYDVTDEVEAYQVQYLVCNESISQVSNIHGITKKLIISSSFAGGHYSSLGKRPNFTINNTLSEIYAYFSTAEPEMFDFKNFEICIKSMAFPNTTDNTITSEAALAELQRNGVNTWNDFYNRLSAAQKNILNIP